MQKTSERNEPDQRMAHQLEKLKMTKLCYVRNQQIQRDRQQKYFKISCKQKRNTVIRTTSIHQNHELQGLIDYDPAKLRIRYRKPRDQVNENKIKKCFFLQHFKVVFKQISWLNIIFDYRYWELVPEQDAAKERIKELEVQLEKASRKLQEQEDKSKQTYLEMYSQGQAAARLEQENAVSRTKNK